MSLSQNTALIWIDEARLMRLIFRDYLSHKVRLIIIDILLNVRASCCHPIFASMHSEAGILPILGQLRILLICLILGLLTKIRLHMITGID